MGKKDDKSDGYSGQSKQSEMAMGRSRTKSTKNEIWTKLILEWYP